MPDSVRPVFGYLTLNPMQAAGPIGMTVPALGRDYRLLWSAAAEHAERRAESAAGI